MGQHRSVERIDDLGSFGGRTAGYLHDVLYGVYGIARIDAFRREAYIEILVELQAGCCLQQWSAYFLGEPGIYSRFIYHDIALFQDGTYGAGGTSYATDVWLVRLVDRCRNRNDIHIALPEVFYVASQFQSLSQGFR